MTDQHDDPQALKLRIEQLERELKTAKGEPETPSNGTPPPSSPPVQQPVDAGLEMPSIQEGDATLRRLVQRIAMILQAEKIVIMFYEREAGELIGIQPGYGVDDHTLEKFKIRATQGISGQVFRDGEPCIYHNAETDPRTRKDMVSLMHVSNGITVPLLIERRDEENRVVDRSTIGVLHAFNKRHGEDFNDEDVRLLERMARNVGSIIANLQLYREVLQEREELLQTFESLTSGLMLISPEGKVSQMNAVARAVYNLGPEIVGGQADTIDDEELQKFIKSGLKGEEPPAIEIVKLIGGTERFFGIQGASVRNEDGRSLGYVIIFNDLTEQKNLDRMKSAFVAMASHELRTPLTAIKGFSSTLLEGLSTDMYEKEDQREFLSIIDQECDRLRRLIDDLLNTARIEANESLKPNYTRFELQPLLEKVLVIQRQSSNRHTLKLDIMTELPETIIGDEDKFDQVLTNFLNNAIKYSPEGGDVTLHAKVDGDWLLVGVEDQGLGIPQEHLNRVFEKFHRVNNEDNRKIYGTGLGLFLVKHLVEQVHMGEVWAESEVGVGSTFWLKIPVELDIEKAKELNQ